MMEMNTYFLSDLTAVSESCQNMQNSNTIYVVPRTELHSTMVSVVIILSKNICKLKDI